MPSTRREHCAQQPPERPPRWGPAPWPFRGFAADAPARKPNILILMCDQERYPQWTPDLPLPARDWIDHRGVSFERFHHSAVQCSPSPRVHLDRHVCAAERDLRQLPAELAVLAGPADPDARRPHARAGLHDRLLRQVAPEHARVRPPEGSADNLKGNYLGPVRLRLLQAGHRRSSRPATTTASTTTRSGPSRASTGCASTAARTSRGCCVVSLLNPHDIAYFPRGYAADVTRPDWQVELPLNFDDDLSDKPKVHSQYANGAALIRGGIEPDDTATWKRLMNTYCDLIVNTDDNYGARPRGAAPLRRDRRHRDHPHGRSRRDGQLAPRRRQGPDDLRGAAAHAALDLLAQALRAGRRTARRRSPRPWTSSPPAWSSPASRTRSPATRGCAAARSCPRWTTPRAPAARTSR